MIEGWKKRKLDEVIDNFIDYRGATPEKSESGIPLITAKIVKNGFIQKPDEYISEDVYQEWMTRGVPNENDVVLTTEAPLGEVARITTDDPVALAQRIITLQGREGVLDNTFLKFCLQSEKMQNRLWARASGSTVQGIKQSELRKVEIDLPPLPTQRRIADILGALDDKIELNRRMNETLEEMAQTLYRHWFVDFGPFQDREFKDTEELGPIPKEWDVKPAYDLCDVLTGGTPKTKKDEYWGGDIKWVSAKDISDTGTFVMDTERKVTPTGVEESTTDVLPERTVVVVARGSVGKHCIIGEDMAMNQSCYGLRGREEIGQSWTYLMLNNLIRRLQQVAYGSVFDTITISTFKNTEIVAPPVEIISRFEEKVDPLFDLMHSNVKENQTLAETRDYLLPKLISGEIEVDAAEEVAGDTMEEIA